MLKTFFVLLAVLFSISAFSQTLSPKAIEIINRAADEYDDHEFADEADYLDTVERRAWEIAHSEGVNLLDNGTDEKISGAAIRAGLAAAKPSKAEAATHDGRGRPDSDRERTRLRNSRNKKPTRGPGRLGGP